MVFMPVAYQLFSFPSFSTRRAWNNETGFATQRDEMHRKKICLHSLRQNPFVTEELNI